MRHRVEVAAGMIVEIEAPDDPDEAVRAAEVMGRAEAGYWGHVWPASVALARHLASSTLVGSGVRVLEIGCGLGLVGIAAARRGADVIMTDLEPPAVEAARRNAAINSVDARCDVFDWRDSPPRGWKPDLIVGADVLYAAVSHEPIGRLVLGLEAVALLTDPNRVSVDGVFSVFERLGLRVQAFTAGSVRLLMVSAGSDRQSVDVSSPPTHPRG